MPTKPRLRVAPVPMEENLTAHLSNLESSLSAASKAHGVLETGVQSLREQVAELTYELAALQEKHDTYALAQEEKFRKTVTGLEAHNGRLVEKLNLLQRTFDQPLSDGKPVDAARNF